MGNEFPLLGDRGFLRRVSDVLAAASLLIVAGCGSSAEDRVYQAFKCGKVATLLEQEAEGNNAFASVLPDIEELETRGVSPARLAMEMNQRFQDDVPLYRFGLGGQMAALSDIYQSGRCQDLYRRKA